MSSSGCVPYPRSAYCKTALDMILSIPEQKIKDNNKVDQVILSFRMFDIFVLSYLITLTDPF